ncbi:MAG: UDP-N-acetylmuramoyl-L-alanine--D-glutamate ligase [Planctomycetia bacterium]|nr:UDP-N-acetylmuramoyl-L-alanine--D-glutamate ligase [Planctomycetia bacterium]
MDVDNCHALVMGLGRHGGGVAAARWLAERGATVTVTDLADADALGESIAELADCAIAAWRLGEHRKCDLDAADVVVVNPAVRYRHPLVERAAARGARITSELELFLERTPARVIAVTGSNGKSTTAAMIAEILKSDGRSTHLGGNIGRSLLADLQAMHAESWAVLEVSSAQLAWLSDDCPLPSLAVLTNFTPNHLDWHGSLKAYAAAKRRLFCRGGRSVDTAVAAGADRVALALNGASRDEGPTRWHEPADDDDVPTLPVPGEHNRADAACAAAAARAVGCAAEAIAAGLRGFAGLPHRLEPAGAVAGREFFNDSMATTPESTAAAVRAFAGRCWLLAGGYDKGLDMSPLLAALPLVHGAAFYGASGPRLHALATRAQAGCPLELFDALDEALEWCWRQSRAGEAIILSPASASYDQFVDYGQRGERFKSLVRALAAR